MKTLEQKLHNILDEYSSNDILWYNGNISKSEWEEPKNKVKQQLLDLIEQEVVDTLKSTKGLTRYQIDSIINSHNFTLSIKDRILQLQQLKENK